jgi:hypothetical protein
MHVLYKSTFVDYYPLDIECMRELCDYERVV